MEPRRELTLAIFRQESVEMGPWFRLRDIDVCREACPPFVHAVWRADAIDSIVWWLLGIPAGIRSRNGRCASNNEKQVSESIHVDLDSQLGEVS